MHPVLLFYWHRTPLLRPLLALCTGILLQWYAPLPVSCVVSTAVTGAALLLAIFFVPDTVRSRATPLALLGSGLLFFSAGVGLCIEKDIRNDPLWIGAAPVLNNESNWALVVTEEPIEKKRSYALSVNVLARYHHSLRYPQRGKALIYVYKDQKAERIQPGDTIWSFRTPQPIESPQNPGERNWQQVQLMKGITHRLYLRNNEYALRTCTTGFVFQKNLSTLRHTLLGTLRRYITDPEALGLAQALLIGYRQDLDPLLSRSYSNTGVIHIIAISGMHLALIGGLLTWGLQPLRRCRFLQQLTHLLVLGSLWLFSLLAGGAPSLLRATLLFSSVAVGEILDRKGNSLNTLLASAFLLLCHDPFWLWDLGFQLSFAAVAGILLVGRYLSKKLSHAKIWWHAVGQLIAISIAAQLFTTPLSLYHFHQFPGAFLAGNLIAVPLSNMVLTALLLLLVCSPFVMPATLLGKGIGLLVVLMNQYIKWLEHIPGLLRTDLQWNLSETLLLLIFLIAVSHWIINQSTSGRLIALLSALLLIGWQASRQYLRSKQAFIIVYRLSGSTAIDWIVGTDCHSWVDSAGTNDPEQLRRTLEQSRYYFGVRRTIGLPAGQLLELGQRKIWIADKKRIPPAPDSTLIDWLVVTQRSPFNGEDWVLRRRIAQVVIDGSVGARTRQRWLRLLDSLAIPTYDTGQTGAFVSSFR